jgi:hypothetical protein
MLNVTRLRAFLAPLSLVLMLGMNFMPAIVHAQGTGLGGALSGGLDKAAPTELQGAKDLNVIIGRLISTIIGFLGVVLFLYLLYGGFIWMTAAGDSKKVETAKDIIRNAIIGLVIIAASYAIANFVISSLATATADTGSGTDSDTP